MAKKPASIFKDYQITTELKDFHMELMSSLTYQLNYIKNREAQNTATPDPQIFAEIQQLTAALIDQYGETARAYHVVNKLAPDEAGSAFPKRTLSREETKQLGELVKQVKKL